LPALGRDAVQLDTPLFDNLQARAGVTLPQQDFPPLVTAQLHMARDLLQHLRGQVIKIWISVKSVELDRLMRVEQLQTGY
jgi:hypothetical protein